MKDFLIENSQAVSSDVELPVWLSAARVSAMDFLSSADFPTVTDEEWKYTNLADLARTPFRRPLPNQSSGGMPSFLQSLYEGSIVFVNGQLRRDLSFFPDGVEILSGQSGLVALSESSVAGLTKAANNDSPVFFAMNLLYFNDFFLLRARKDVGHCHIFHYFSGLDGCAFFPRTCIQIEQGAALNFSESFFVEGTGCFIGNVSDIYLEKDASVEYLRASVHKASSFQVSATRIHQARDSHSQGFFFTNGAGLVRDNLTVFLNEEGSDAIINGLHDVSGTAHADSHTYIEHIAPHTTSSQLYKSILHDEARSVFNGKIVVRREAQQTNSYQLNKNLLLSREARVDTKPQLQIMADDVKCSHGATIGQLDDDQLFYLQSRGIARDEALRMLIGGFIDDVTGRISAPLLKARLAELMK